MVPGDKKKRYEHSNFQYDRLCCLGCNFIYDLLRKQIISKDKDILKIASFKKRLEWFYQNLRQLFLVYTESYKNNINIKLFIKMKGSSEPYFSFSNINVAPALHIL